jgi:hypothetical protein
MALTGPRAQALLSEVLDRIRPYLPAGIRVEMLPHKKWTTLAGNSGGGYGTTIRGITSPAFLPRRTRAKVTAQRAVEIVLEVAYRTADGVQQPLDVRAVLTGDEVSVSYLPPGAGARVDLPPIPLSSLL